MLARALRGRAVRAAAPARTRTRRPSAGAAPARGLGSSLEHLSVGDLVVERGLRAAPELEDTLPVSEAVGALVELRASSALTKDASEGRITGILTARDLLRWLHERPDAPDAPLAELATPETRVAWCAPEDSLERAQSVMRALGVRNLPVADAGTGEVLGMLTAKDVGDYLFEREPCSTLGGKEAFLRAAKGRHGLPEGAAVAPPDRAAHLVSVLSGKGGVDVVPQPAPHALGVGHHCLPNPLKRDDGTVGHARRDLGGHELNHDADLAEDAWFVHQGDATYVGVFDGVGSWRKLGVDPRRYPRALAKGCERALAELERPPPDEVLTRAWRRVTEDGVAGSSTALVVTLRRDRNQLAYCSLGDCGVVVLRNPELAGTAASGSGSRRAPVLVAAQQLRDFNLPYQLGWTNEGGTRPFETPAQANVGSFPVHVGDVVICATDGLFDNVAIDDVAAVCEAWERSDARSDRHALARMLCDRARELSLDDSIDSPFALLAKENDIMWGGGMPDDVTVVCLTVEAAAAG